MLFGQRGIGTRNPGGVEALSLTLRGAASGLRGDWNAWNSGQHFSTDCKRWRTWCLPSLVGPALSRARAGEKGGLGGISVGPRVPSLLRQF